MRPAARFVKLTSWIRRSLPRVSALWSGFWLGVLPDSAIAAIDEALYDLSLNYHSREHNLQGLTPWETEAISRYFQGCRRLMVLAAGGGREVIALRRLGFEAFGWESHPALVATATALAGAEGWSGVIAPSVRDALPETTSLFDGVILGWSMYTLIHGHDRRVALLRGVRDRLPAGGPVLLSFWTRAEDDSRAWRVFQTGRIIRRLQGRPGPDLGDDMLPNVVHRFTRAQIADELAAAGFDLLRWEPSGNGPTASGWAVATRA